MRDTVYTTRHALTHVVSAASTAGGGTGFVKNVTFADFQGTWETVDPTRHKLTVRPVANVDNPITINQCYSTPADVCAQFPSTLSISDVHCKYRCVQRRHEADVLVSVINVTGTSSGKEGDVVVDIECSAQCVDITATGTQITSPKGPSVYVCANVESENQVR